MNDSTDKSLRISTQEKNACALLTDEQRQMAAVLGSVLADYWHRLQSERSGNDTQCSSAHAPAKSDSARDEA